MCQQHIRVFGKTGTVGAPVVLNTRHFPDGLPLSRFKCFRADDSRDTAHDEFTLGGLLCFQTVGEKMIISPGFGFNKPDPWCSFDVGAGLVAERSVYTLH